MDKYDYVTATIEEERERLEKILRYLRENNSNDEDLNYYSERYNNVLRYLNAKSRYLSVLNSINKDKLALEELLVQKEEYAVDNILLEDTLLNKFNEDTDNKYKSILYEDIKNEEEDIRDILYLLIEKESNYPELVIKRERLKERIDKNRFPKTYNTIISQDVLIQKQESILDEIYIIENSIKIEESKLRAIENMVMTDGILKLLYEFWIVSSYDPRKVERDKLFSDNNALIHIKDSDIVTEEDNESSSDNNSDDNSADEEEKEDIIFSDLNLPGINEDMTVDIDGKNYVENN